MFTLILYKFIMKLIHIFKWFELQLYRRSFLNESILKKVIELPEAIGLVLHFTEDGDIFPENWTKEQEEMALKKCQESYSSLVHLKVNNKVEFISRVYEAGYIKYYLNPINRLLIYLEMHAFNFQTKLKSENVVAMQYDLGNHFYQSFLDPKLQYSCGYWAKSDNLSAAQLAKMDLIARKLDLKPGMRVLDIGCGFGMLCRYLAVNYRVKCIGITISKEQADFATKVCRGFNVEIRMQDYLDLNEQFDRIVCIGMLENVGFRNYKTFFNVAHRNLKKDGIFLVQTIGGNHKEMPKYDLWLQKYISPNRLMPYPKEITMATEGTFIIEDWHNFGQDYARTLKAWLQNFKMNWNTIENKYGAKFYRMWVYYLAMCTGGFFARKLHLWQLVLSKDGIKHDYRAAR